MEVDENVIILYGSKFSDASVNGPLQEQAFIYSKGISRRAVRDSSETF